MIIDYRIDIFLREDTGTKHLASWSETISDTFPNWGNVFEFTLASNASVSNVGNYGEFLYIESNKAITVQFDSTAASAKRFPVVPTGTAGFGKSFLVLGTQGTIFLTNESGSEATVKIITAGS